MISSGPLAGRTIVVTRPRAQAAPLAKMIAAAGGTALLFPLLEIAPADDLAALNRAAAEFSSCALAVFVSPNAVRHALPFLLAGRSWPVGVVPAAVGPGTLKALADAGVSGCLLPAGRYDSEGLLELPELSGARMAGQRVFIFRGDGGRELLADTLRERGARVECISCYRRSGPAASFSPLLDAWRDRRLDAMVVSSSEALRYLVAGLDAEGRDWLQETPLFVPHARIAEVAGELGLRRIVPTAAADKGLIEGLLAYNWPA